ncbi:helix-turn-helix transcriptional regulator [Rhodothermus profundi]|uniref:Predicted DNA-binding transcriptional regulator YafY, contains an HTH and WYL domains n=1 Tax=Rhodothermus profundi TaxID=633813 RepID=A0A1M6RBP0_9BACT|nr:YafY family protein [Rhodothermus profundi]SHK29871.1 Predicted DNA-binding transcriptional regulator YafY, contains an HTH and WYL domains [Rhodothermus profundi]
MKLAERSRNRTERLFALILLLQTRPGLTAQQLAEHFGVSRRTIFRDLRALSEANVPLTYAEGGGYEILEGYQLPPLMFTAREAATLLIGTAFIKRQPDASLRADADAVALKIRSVLPQPIREYIDRLQERIVIDPYWLQTMQGSGEETGYWYELSEAIARQQSVHLAYYVPSRDELTQRKVDPLGLVYYTDHWNLIAYDHLRKDIRNFRLDRIQRLAVLSERFTPPRDFDLNAYLEAQGAPSEAYRIRLRFAPATYRWARRSIPARIESEQETPEGIEVTFAFENLEYLARWLLRYGTEVEVLAPEALRAQLRAQARAVLARYEPAPPHEETGTSVG